MRSLDAPEIVIVTSVFAGLFWAVYNWMHGRRKRTS